MRSKSCFYLTLGCFAFFVFFISEGAYAIIDDEQIDNFLFRINDNLKSKVINLNDEKVEDLTVPVLGVSLGDIDDTWHAPRSGGRVHLGTDIMAPRGTGIVTPTRAIVTNVGYDSMGGNYVITANPGGEQFYYAHLDKVAEYINPGVELEKNDLIGYAGNTGNATGRNSHLHLGIYHKGEWTNPYSRLTQELSRKEISEIESRICLNGASMTIGAEGSCVLFIQEFLIDKNSGDSALKLASVGATGYFGSLTRDALAEYQLASGITPAQGYFGPITQKHLSVLLLIDEGNRQIAEIPQEIKIETADENLTSGELKILENQMASIFNAVSELTKNVKELINI